MSLTKAAVIKFSHEIWERPSLKHAVYVGTLSLLITLLAQGTLDVFYAGGSLKSQPESYEYGADLRTAIMLVLVAPLLETLISQAGVIGLLGLIRVNGKLVVWLSAIGFAYMHFWTTPLSADVLIQMLPIIPTGYLLGALYYKLLKREGWRSGFKYTMIAHATHNGIVFGLICILEFFPD